MTSHMLTTIDNPFNPFTQWDSWLAYDSHLGYNTPSLLARVVRTSDEVSPKQQELDIEYAMDEVVKTDLLGVYRKISLEHSRIK